MTPETNSARTLDLSFLPSCAKRVIPPSLHPVLDLILKNGKHIRPSLGVRLCHMLNVDPAPLYDAFTGIELIHAASLVHDDIVDEDAFRRNDLSVHSRFGTHLGLLYGDYFFVSALQLFAQKKYSPRMLVHVLSAVQSMTHAQILESSNQVDSLEKYWEYSRGKTAELMRLCATLILEHYGMTHATAEDFALKYGLAFQVADDLSESPDKKNEITLPAFIGREAAAQTFQTMCKELDAMQVIPTNELSFILFEQIIRE